MLIMSVLIGGVSVATGYFWWTHDWWRPLTITGTRVGIEDFLVGFAGGGVMAVIYEELFRKRLYKRESNQHHPGGFTILLLLAQITSILIWGLHFSSFWASTIAMIFIAAVMFYYRRDLIIAGFLTGICMFFVSIVFYSSILFFYPSWARETYLFSHLSGITFLTYPVEEYIFWFLAGFMWGPFYEYWQGERLRTMTR